MTASNSQWSGIPVNGMFYLYAKLTKKPTPFTRAGGQRALSKKKRVETSFSKIKPRQRGPQKPRRDKVFAV